MACYVYVLGSHGNGGWKTYVGWSTDIEQRLASHNDGTGARSTRGRRWMVLYGEKFKTRGSAMSREWHLKRDRKFRRALSENYL
jgi:putative endonuclease